MQAPNVRNTVANDVEDNHLHCRSCGFKISVNTDSRFCSTCANKSDIPKFVYYLEIIALVVVVGYVLFGYLYATSIIAEWATTDTNGMSEDPEGRSYLDEDIYFVIPLTISGSIVVWFWYFKRLKYVDAQSYPYPKRVVESGDNLELQKINEDIQDLNRRKRELEKK